MNGNDILLDTNIVLYLLDGDHEIAELLNGKRLYVSFITELELLSFEGLQESENQTIRAFLRECIIVNINEIIKEHAINVRKHDGLKLPDAIIVGTSNYLLCPIITADKGFLKAENSDLILYQIGK